MLSAKSGQKCGNEQKRLRLVNRAFLVLCNCLMKLPGFDWNQSPDEDLANPLTIQPGRTCRRREDAHPASARLRTNCPSPRQILADLLESLCLHRGSGK